MKSENILAVIDELGKIILNYQMEISLNEYEIDKLSKKIKNIEQYIETYIDKENT